MGDHVVVDVDRFVTPQTNETIQEKEGSSSSVGEPAHAPSVPSTLPVGSERGEEDERMDGNDEEPLVQMGECRICQEEDHIKNLETPCACSGSLKYAHRACVQRWCNEKGDITCEICHELYKPGYTAPPRIHPDETTIDISEGWTIAGAPLDLHDPRILAMAAAQRHLLEAEYDEYAATNASGATFCRSFALILILFLLLRHALVITNGDEDEDTSAFFSLFLLRVAGFILPCYIMAWAISLLQRRRQRQEAAAMAANEVAFILRSAQARGLQFTITPDSPTTPQQEPRQ